MSAPVLLVTSYLPLVTTSLTSASGVEVAGVGVEHAPRTNTREPTHSMLVNFISCYLLSNVTFKTAYKKIQVICSQLTINY